MSKNEKIICVVCNHEITGGVFYDNGYRHAECREINLELTSLRERVEKLLATLKLVEWIQPNYSDDPFCEVCGNSEWKGHKDNCAIRAALESAK